MLFFVLLGLLGLVQSAFIDYNYGGRTNKLYVPSHYKAGTAYPLFVMLHGCTQNPTDFATGTNMNSFAESQGFLVLYLLQTSSANANKCWNWFLPAHQKRGSGEPDFIAGATLQVMKDYTIDKSAVSVSGLSAGAAMSVIMAFTYSDIYCCVGVAAGLEFKAAQTSTEAFMAMSSGGPNPSTSAQLAWDAMKSQYKNVPLQVVVFHGNKDYTVALVNGNQTTSQCIQTANLGFGSNRIPTTPTSTEQGTVPGGHKYWTYKYDGLQTGIPVVTYVLVEGMAHAWSGGSSGGTYTDPKGPSMSEVIIKNFLSWSGSTTGSGTSSTSGPSTTGPATTGPSSTTGGSTSGATTGSGTSSGTSSTGPSTTGSTTGGKMVVSLNSVLGYDGYVSQILADGYSTAVCKVGDKGMYTADSFRTLLIFPTQDLPKSRKIEKAVLSITIQSTTGTVNTLNVDMNEGPFNGSLNLSPSDYYAVAKFPGVASFSPSSLSVVLPESLHNHLQANDVSFRLSSKTTASLGANTVFIGCGASTLTVTYSE